jgi:hypothetical protein
MDYETFVGSVDIKKVGAYRYSRSPDCEILCCALALGDEEPYVWKQGERLEEKYWWLLQDPDVLIYAFSAQFEIAISTALMEKTWGIPCPALSRFRCVQSLARRASLPAKLDKLGEVLNLHHQKDRKGKSLIKKFSQLQPPRGPTKKHPQGQSARRIFPADEPEAFADFCRYCSDDVKSEREAAHRLAYFDCSPNTENYTLDAIINARGVTVNLEALRHAQTLIDEETEIVSRKFRAITGFEHTQGAVFLKWLKDQGLTHMDDLQAETIEATLEQWDEAEAPPTIQALRLKQSIAYASIKKVATMIACAGPNDNRIRGLLNHHGCTTGRWTASLVQFQNMKRPTMKDTEGAYQMICDGCSREMLEICYGPVLEVISSCIRHFVHDVEQPKPMRYYIHPESSSYFISAEEQVFDGCLEEVDREDYERFVQQVKEGIA